MLDIHLKYRVSNRVFKRNPLNISLQIRAFKQLALIVRAKHQTKGLALIISDSIFDLNTTEITFPPKSPFTYAGRFMDICDIQYQMCRMDKVKYKQLVNIKIELGLIWILMC